MGVRPAWRWAASAFLFWLTATSAGSAQPALRRGTPIQPFAAVRGGEFLVGVGAAYEEGFRFPLLALKGDMSRLAILQLSWAPADGVLIELRGDAYRALTIDRLDPPPADSFGVPFVKPDEGVLDGKSTGAGDFHAGLVFHAIGDSVGLAVGGRLDFNIPDSNQAEGLGTNTINIRMGVLGSYGGGGLRITGELGLGILEAPVQNFEQNDVLVYAAELLYSPLRSHRLRVFASVDGRASTRDDVPLGTEDLGRASLGLEYRRASWRVDGGGFVGYAGTSADYGLFGGVAYSPSH